MDRNSLLNDSEAAIIYALDGRQSKMWTSMPGIVKDVNFLAMTCTVQPAIQGVYTNDTDSQTYINLPLLVDVPICFPSAGGFLLTLPLKANDEVLIVIASRCIDSWWQSGGVQPPMEMRMHDLSDGFAIPGPRSQVNLPGGAISPTDAQFRDSAGVTYVSIGASGKIGFQNSVVSLKTTLSDLQSALNAFMTTLSGFSGGGSPVTQAMLQVPASAAVTALGNVLIEIGALLQ
jgi:Phage protein Gp138 N-terminal domain